MIQNRPGNEKYCYRTNLLLFSFLIHFFSIIPYKSFSQDIPDNIAVLLDELPPLNHKRKGRELIYQYSVGNLKSLAYEDAKKVITELAKRGVGVISFWEKGEKMEFSVEECLRIGRIQQELGLSVVIDASRLLYGFYDDTPASAHINDKGDCFTDSSFSGRVMGCPFSVHRKIPLIKSRVTAFAEAYKAAGLNIDIATADWEIDGPLEWNDAWENSKKCILCRKNVVNINDFISFQAKIRSLRSKLMYECYTTPMLQRFSEALITNYATYPNDGLRYWYDYFEYLQPELPHIKDQEACYRPWYDEFTETGFTLAMPVVYTWYPTYTWYPNYSPDYRWFYNMLKVASNAGESTPSEIPLATFVHWHTTAPPKNPDPGVKQMSQETYQELLWHLLLRGHDILYSWCMRNELATEMFLIQSVYDRSLEYNKWFKYGRPVIFDVPVNESSVISAIKIDNEILVRRTDFDGNTKPVNITIEGIEISVPYRPGDCQVLSLLK